MASPDCDTNPWRPIGSSDSCADWTGDSDWILETGSWDDLGFWRDLALWNDGANIWEDYD